MTQVVLNTGSILCYIYPCFLVPSNLCSSLLVQTGFRLLKIQFNRSSYDWSMHMTIKCGP